MKLTVVHPVYVLVLSIVQTLSANVAIAASETYSLEVSVYDEEEEPLYGVIVFANGSDYQGSTDEKGQLKLSGIHLNDKISFSHTGFETLVIPFRELRGLQGHVQLKLTTYILPISVTIGRRNDALGTTPQQVEVVSRKQIQSINPATSADALGQFGGVYIQKSQLGGGSPIIRGFEANRVLLVVDGVRLNNAIYRNGHLQNAISIDPLILEQAEVISGPGSLMYGSDAIGGVIHFRTRNPKLLQQDNPQKFLLETNFSGKYASAEDSRTAHLDLNFGLRKWAFLTSFSIAEFGDLRAGSDRPAAYPDFGKRSYYVGDGDEGDAVFNNPNPDLQIGTAYSQYDVLQKIRFKPNDHLYFDVNLQVSNTSDVPRYDQLTELNSDAAEDLRFAEWYYGPQFRALASFRTRILKSTPLFDRASIIGSYQRIGEDRHQRRFGRDLLESTLLDLDVYNFSADFDKQIGRNLTNSVSYGIELNHNDVRSEGFGTSVSSYAISNSVNARYPSGGSSLNAMGIYFNYTLKSLDSRIAFNAGLRYNYTSLEAKFSPDDPIAWPSTYLDGITNGNSALTWATGLVYKLPRDWHLKLSAGTAFRAPNIDDFAKFREKNGFVTVPNPYLKPERAFSTEMTLAKEIKKVSIGKGEIASIKISGTAFYTDLKDAIVRQNFLMPNGSPLFVSYDDTLYVQANVNSDMAQVYGFSGNIDIRFNKHWRLRSGINYTKGRRSFTLKDNSGNVQLETLVPQDHIPPLYGQTQLTFEKGKLAVNGIIRYNGAKKEEDYAVSSIELYSGNECGSIVIDRQGTADNIEQGVIRSHYGDCESPYEGLYGWVTFNLYSSYQITKNLSINLGMENITDRHYRHFASGVSAPGRNLIIAFKGNF